MTSWSERNRGPIPEGRYTFNPANVQNYDDLSLAQKLASLVPPQIRKTGEWPGGVAAWGRQRVELSAEPGTNTYGRSGFFIHGDLTPGSVGRIDLRSREVDFFCTVGPSSDDLLVEVDYP